MDAGMVASIALGDLALSTTDGDGVTWQFDSIEGWHSGPGVELQQTQRVVGHGQFARKGRRTGRQIIIAGSVRGATRAPLERARLHLASLLADGGSQRLYFDDADGLTLWASVQLADAPRIEWNGLNHFRYQLTLLAPDAFRYGETSTASTTFATDAVGVGLVFPLFDPADVLDFGPVPTSDGSATVVNNGSASASPVFTVAGPTPVGGFSITDLGSGERLRFLGVVPDGSTLVLDASDGSVVLNGTADRSSDLISSRWPSVAPGGQVTYRFAPESSPSAATLTVDLVSTYW